MRAIGVARACAGRKRDLDSAQRERGPPDKGAQSQGAHTADMASRERAKDRAARLAVEALSAMVHEFRQRRLALGLSQATVAAAAGMSASRLSRIERDPRRRTSLLDLFAIGEALGLDIRLNAYQGGRPVHDHVQIRLLPAVRQRIHALLGWLTEVPLPIAGDRRAWDAIATTDDGWTAFEVIARLGAVDATVRQVRQKQRDDRRVGRVILIVADTRRNREALAAARAILATEFPLRNHDALADLAEGRTPPADGIVLLRVPAQTL